MPNTLTSISGYINRIKHIVDALPEDKVLVYRGHSNRKYMIEPSLFREEGWKKNEDKLFKEAILENPYEFHDDDTTLEKLVRMQHFALPTRILDLTENPLVALYFACAGKNGKNENGEVVYLSIPKASIKYYDSDTVSVLSNLAKMDNEMKNINFELSLEKFNETKEVLQLVHAIREEKPYFDPIIKPEDVKRTICVRVKKNNQRIMAQNGLFLLFGIKETKKEYVPMDWFPTMDVRRSIIIDKNAKSKLIKDLSLVNICERTMFPGIEKTSKQIRDKYM